MKIQTRDKDEDEDEEFFFLGVQDLIGLGSIDTYYRSILSPFWLS